MKQERQPQIEVSGSAPNRMVQMVFWKKSPSVDQWHGKNWKTYHFRFRKEWLQRVGLILRGKINFQKARIRATRYSTTEIDAENATAGLKPITDAFKTFGLIPDDSKKHVPYTPIVDQVKVKKRIDERTVIIVEELT